MNERDKRYTWSALRGTIDDIQQCGCECTSMQNARMRASVSDIGHFWWVVLGVSIDDEEWVKMRVWSEWRAPRVRAW